MKNTTQNVKRTPHNNFVDSRYGTINNNFIPFMGSDMQKSLGKARFFESNVTAMGGCKFVSRRDIGIIAPKELYQGFESIV